MTFHLDRRSKIIISYKITVTCDKPYSPGGDFLPSRQSDAIGVRLSVDGQPHRQSGSHANPFSSYESSSSELEGYIILDLSAGDHIAKLQWKKWGSFVFSWTSNPTLVGGFSAARTIEVSSQHKYLWSVQPLNFAHISQNKNVGGYGGPLLLPFSCPRNGSCGLYIVLLSDRIAPRLTHVWHGPLHLSLTFYFDFFPHL